MKKNQGYSYRLFFRASVLIPFIMLCLGLTFLWIERPGDALGDVFSLIFLPIAALFFLVITILGFILSLMEKNSKARWLIVFPILMITTFIFPDSFELVSEKVDYLTFTCLFLVAYAFFTCFFWYLDRKKLKK